MTRWGEVFIDLTCLQSFHWGKGRSSIGAIYGRIYEQYPRRNPEDEQSQIFRNDAGFLMCIFRTTRFFIIAQNQTPGNWVKTGRNSFQLIDWRTKKGKLWVKKYIYIYIAAKMWLFKKYQKKYTRTWLSLEETAQNEYQMLLKKSVVCQVVEMFTHAVIPGRTPRAGNLPGKALRCTHIRP